LLDDVYLSFAFSLLQAEFRRNPQCLAEHKFLYLIRLLRRRYLASARRPNA
jgi:hypothetical protein